MMSYFGQEMAADASIDHETPAFIKALKSKAVRRTEQRCGPVDNPENL
jgi:hypothetical protein